MRKNSLRSSEFQRELDAWQSMASVDLLKKKNKTKKDIQETAI